jgi:hypothetical protein
MRNLFILAIILDIVCLSACEQKLKESQVPAAVKAAFEREYPNTKATWDKEDQGYEAEFKKDGKEMSVIIDGSGKIIETETMIAVTDLPAPISDYMSKHYSGMKVEEAAKIINANGDVTYEAEIKEKDVVFDANGNFLKEEKD